MTSSNHVLLISDEDNVRTRKASTSSSLDSWEGLGLEDESNLFSNPHCSRSRPYENQKGRAPTKYVPHSTSVPPRESVKSAFVPLNVQTHRNVPRTANNIQQNVKFNDHENHGARSNVSHFSKNSKPHQKSATDQTIYFPSDAAIRRQEVNSSVPSMRPTSKSFAPAAHLVKAERIPRTATPEAQFQLNTSAKPSNNLPMKFHQNPIQQGSPVDQTEKMKTKLMSVWNNMKYGWTVRSKTSFSGASPIYFLGHMYEENHIGEYHRLHGESNYEKFLLDFSSRVWLTYRRDFPVLEDSTLTTDCGWGCMLRSGQMMLAQALLTHFLGRGWRLSGVPQTEKSERLHHMVVRWFGDLPCDLCPFSLHRLVSLGRNVGKKAGDWYGPASVAHLIKQAMESAALENPSLDDLCVYVAQDCTVYKQDVIDLCTRPNRIKKIQERNTMRNSPLPPPLRYKLPVALPREPVIDWKDVLEDPKASEQMNPRSPYQFVSRDFHSPPKSPLSRTWSNPSLDTSSDRLSPLPSMGQSSFPSGTSLDCTEEHRDRWRSLVVLVPVRLGGDRLNKIYFPCINRLLAHECSIGIIGGRPRHSLYFVGFQDDKLINLDPHYCQEVVDVRLNNFPLESFQCTDPRKIPITKMDPSCTIGFYFRTREDFEKFTDTVEPLLSSGDGKSDYPVFIISAGSSSSNLCGPSGQDYEKSVDDPNIGNNLDLDGDDFVLI